MLILEKALAQMLTLSTGRSSPF